MVAGSAMFAAHSQHVHRDGKMPLTDAGADVDPSGKPLASASLQVLHHKQRKCVVTMWGFIITKTSTVLLNVALFANHSVKPAVSHLSPRILIHRACMMAVSPVHCDGHIRLELHRVLPHLCCLMYSRLAYSFNQSHNEYSRLA